MDAFATLVRSIFQKDSLQDCSVEELQSIARQYPYFTPVQFLLTEKLRSTDENLYKEQLQKLSLHFSNPLWLNYLLNGYNEKVTTDTSDQIKRDEQTVGEIEQEPLATPEDVFLKSEIEIAEPIKEEIIEPTEITASTSQEDRIAGKEEIIETGNRVEDSHVDITEPINEQMTAEVADENIQPEEENFDAPGQSTSELSGIESSSANEGQFAKPHVELPDLQKEPEDNQLTFEPYHTVDYFASQGIKFIPEEKPSDRFGQQLKSFTEWLKTMKRLPHAEISKMSDASSEEKIQQLADHSVTEGEVLTETMAEVWAKQGNKEKAIETYNKLSLLNPDKSAYFASLIDQLKNS